MGIPKFYRWLSERYPLLNQPVTATAAPPQIDNLYLDMNGIIHNCTHGNDPNVKLTEEEMILRIFVYLDKLVQIIKPKKMLCMAIDGVAPRAKMNQQRARRFKTGREREEAERAAEARGEPLSKDRFDSNCITPGTPFMARLGDHLRYFVRLKTSTDQTWKSMKVLFSGHEVPGEGEHKIMEYIRLQKRTPSYRPNQRHCMYGLDADLIMLSLVTHEPHFCLLREVVSYSGNNKGQPAREVLENPCAEHFILFQIGLLREYIGLEFSTVTLPFKLDIERIIDDFVLFCMLIGNDFLPALPTLDISEGALNKLLDTYAALLPDLGGYLTYGGELDRTRLEKFMKCIADMEMETLKERAEDAEYFERKRAKARGADATLAVVNNAPVRRPVVDIDKFEAELAAMVNREDPPPAAAAAAAAAVLPVATPADLFGPLEEEEDVPVVPTEPTMMAKDARDLFLLGDEEHALRLWRERYYKQKLECQHEEDERQVLVSYIEGLHWVLEYYYRGVASWDWYYPYHYAPMASDFKDLDSITVRFSQGTPFRPFEQLLSVLPASSSKHLPQPFRWLMTDASSPIFDFYPTNFTVDMEGKRADWEGVVKIPFIDQHRLLSAAKLVSEEMLTPEERLRNKLGHILVFSHDPTSKDMDYCKSTLPMHYADVSPCLSSVVLKPPPPPLPPKEKGFVPQLMPGTEVGIKNPPGFPTLQTMQVTPEVRNAGINVFGAPSRKASLILKLRDLHSLPNAAALTASQVAETALGERCYVKWPYLQEAYICGISDQTELMRKDGSQTRTKESGSWRSQANSISNTMLTKSGIDIGNVDLLLHVRICTCCVRNIDGTVEKRFSEDEVLYPLQAVLRVHPLEQAQAAAGGKPEDFGVPKLVFKPGMQVLYSGQNYYGCVARLLSVTEVKGGPKKKPTQSWRISIELPPPALKDAQLQAKRVLKNHVTQYVPSGQVARKLGVSPRSLGRITGNLWVVDSAAPAGPRRGDDRMDIGIAVKNASKGLCVPGYSQPFEGNNGWGYSNALVQILQQHKQQCGWLWKALDDFPDASPLDLAEVFPKLSVEERKAKAEAAKKWVNSTQLSKRPLVKTTVQMVSDDALLALQVSMPPALGKAPAAVVVDNVAPQLLLPPHDAGELISELAGGEFELGDRVACLSSRGCPPFGAHGTVIGIHDEACEVLFDEKFNGANNLNGRLRSNSGLAVLKVLLLNIAKPRFSVVAKNPASKVVKTQTSKTTAPISEKRVDGTREKSSKTSEDILAGFQTSLVAAPGVLYYQQAASSLPPPGATSSQNPPTLRMLSVSDIESRAQPSATAAAVTAVNSALSRAPNFAKPAQSPTPPNPTVLAQNLLLRLQGSTEKPQSNTSIGNSAMPAAATKHMGAPSPRTGKSMPPPGLAPPGFSADPPGLAGPVKAAGSPAVTALAKPAQEAAAAALRLPLQSQALSSSDQLRSSSLTDAHSPAASAVAAATRFIPPDVAKNHATRSGPGMQQHQGASAGQTLLARLTGADRAGSGTINGGLPTDNMAELRPVRTTDISPPPGCFELPSNTVVSNNAARGRGVALKGGSPGSKATNSYYDSQVPRQLSPREDNWRWTSDPSAALGNGGGSGSLSPLAMAATVEDGGKTLSTKAVLPLTGRSSRMPSKMLDNGPIYQPKLPETGKKGFSIGRGKPILRHGPPVPELVAPGSMPPLRQLNPNHTKPVPKSAQPLHAGPLAGASVSTQPPPVLLQPAPGVTMPGAATSPAGFKNGMPPGAARGLTNVDLAQNLLDRLHFSGVELPQIGAAGVPGLVQAPQQPGNVSRVVAAGEVPRQVVSGTVSPFSHNATTPPTMQTPPHSLAESPDVRQMLLEQLAAGGLLPAASASAQPAISFPPNLAAGHFLLQKIQAAASAGHSQPNLSLPSQPSLQTQFLSPRSDTSAFLQPSPTSHSTLLQPAPQHLQSAGLQPAPQPQQIPSSQAPSNQAVTLQALQAALMASTAALQTARSTPREVPSPSQQRALPSCFLQRAQNAGPAQQQNFPSVSLASLTPLLASPQMQQQLGNTLGAAGNAGQPTLSLQQLLSAPLAAHPQPAQPIQLPSNFGATPSSAMFLQAGMAPSNTLQPAPQLSMNPQTQQPSSLLNILRTAAAGPNPSHLSSLLHQNAMLASTPPAPAMPSMGQQLLQTLQRGAINPAGGLNPSISGISSAAGGINLASHNPSMHQLAQALMQQQPAPQSALHGLVPTAPGVLGTGLGMPAGLQQAPAHHHLVGGMQPSPAAGLPKETLLALLQRNQAGASGMVGGGFAAHNAGGNIPAVHGYDLASLHAMGPQGYHQHRTL